MTRRASRLAALIVFALALCYFLSYMRYGFAYDEGYLLDGVEKIMEGQVIYRDFHHTYAPGRFYLVAAAFSAFGKNLIVERVIFALLQALKCSLAFMLVFAVTRNGFALVAPILIMIAPGPWHKVFFSSLGFLATYLVLTSICRSLKWVLVCGAGVGLCAAFRQDTASFAVVGGIAGILVHELGKGRGIAGSAARVGMLLAGIAVVAVPVLLYFHLEHALGPMVHKMTKDGMIDNMTNRIPYPGLASRMGIDAAYVRYILPVRLLFYLPFVVYALAAAVAVRYLAARRRTGSLTGMIVILTVSVLAFNQSMWRSDIGHLLQTMQYVYLLVAILLGVGYSSLIQRCDPRGWKRAVLICALFAIAPLMLLWAAYGCAVGSTDRAVAARFVREGVSVGDTEYLGSAFVRIGNNTPLGLERAPVYVLPVEARFFSAVKGFLDTHTSAGEYILAVPQLQVLYFLFDRKNPTRYAHYRRALDPAEEAQYIEDIKSHGTTYIFLTEPFEGARLGQTERAFGDYARRVREWVLDNYTVVDRIGSVKVLRRKT